MNALLAIPIIYKTHQLLVKLFVHKDSTATIHNAYRYSIYNIKSYLFHFISVIFPVLHVKLFIDQYKI